MPSRTRAEEAVLDAVNDTLEGHRRQPADGAGAGTALQFHARRTNGPQEGYEYGEGGYDPKGTNIGFNEATGQFHVELKGLAEPQSEEAKRICQEDLNEVITAFVQDTRTMAKGLFDEETAPQELTITRMGKIVRDKYPDLPEEDQEAIRQRAVAALNLIQQAKKQLGADAGADDLVRANTALIDWRAPLRHGRARAGH